MHKKFYGFMVIALVGIFAFSGFAKADVNPGEGDVDEFTYINYRIFDVGDDPYNPQSSPTSIQFHEGDGIDVVTQATPARQCIQVTVAGNAVDGRVTLFLDNAGGATPLTIGPRIEDEATADYEVRAEELDYLTNTEVEPPYNHPYLLSAEEEALINLPVGEAHKPYNFEAGLVGNNSPPDEDIKMVVPMFWQVYDDWQPAYPAELSLDSWHEYKYDIPYSANDSFIEEHDDPIPDEVINLDPQFRSPQDWWATTKDQYQLDFDWKMDFEPESDEVGHYVVSYVSGHPYHNFWLTMKDYRTICEVSGAECKLGHYPGLRETDSASADYGKRLDDTESQNPIVYDADGIPQTDDNWGMRLDAIEVDPDTGEPVEVGPDIFGYRIYVYLGANLTSKYAQDYSSSRLILKMGDIEYPIQVDCFYLPDKEVNADVKANIEGEREDDGLWFCENNPGNDPEPTACNDLGVNHGVMSRQYMEVTGKSNTYDSRVLVYVDNTHNDASPKYTGRRTVYDAGYAPEAGPETDYRHPFPEEPPADLNHPLPPAESGVNGTNALESTLKPRSFTRGLVHESEDSRYILPIFWRVYDVEHTDSIAELPAYPEYDEIDAWTPDPYSIGWGHIHDPYSFEWDWQLEYDADWNPTGHFQKYYGDPDDLKRDGVVVQYVDGVTPENSWGWMPMKYDRTVIYLTPMDTAIYGEDWDGWLGNYPCEGYDPLLPLGQRCQEVYEDGFLALPGTLPVYLYFATNYSEAAVAGRYATSRIIVDFE